MELACSKFLSLEAVLRVVQQAIEQFQLFTKLSLATNSGLVLLWPTFEKRLSVPMQTSPNSKKVPVDIFRTVQAPGY